MAKAIFGKIKSYHMALAGLLLALILMFFDVALSVGLLFLAFLIFVVFLILYNNNQEHKKIFLLFLIPVLAHLAVVLLLYFSGFGALGGGADYDGYNTQAIELAGRFRVLNLSFEGIGLLHYFPVLIGIIYALVLPEMFVGQMFVIWLSGLSAILLYFLTLEFGGPKKSAFVAGIFLSVYPSYLYFGSLLLKDTLVVPFVLLGLLLAVKMLKNFKAINFLWLFVILTALTHLRFYIGFALIFSFIICWFLLSELKIKERFFWGLTIVFLLGFPPQLAGDGYYGIKNIQAFLTPEKITFYREIAYNALAIKKTSEEPKTKEPEITEDEITQPKPVETKIPPTLSESEIKEPEVEQSQTSGQGSSFVVKTGIDEGVMQFSANYLISFIYSSFGPFPWQLRFKRHLMFLAETVPWYFLWCLFILGVYEKIKSEGFAVFIKKHKMVLQLILFNILALGALALYINNFGIIARIRIPMFVSILAIMALFINFEIYEKIFNYWRSWIYRLKSC